MIHVTHSCYNKSFWIHAASFLFPLQLLLFTIVSLPVSLLPRLLYSYFPSPLFPKSTYTNRPSDSILCVTSFSILSKPNFRSLVKNHSTLLDSCNRWTNGSTFSHFLLLPHYSLLSTSLSPSFRETWIDQFQSSWPTTDENHKFTPRSLYLQLWSTEKSQLLFQNSGNFTWVANRLHGCRSTNQSTKPSGNNAN